MSLEGHPLFSQWRDPQSGVVSYILDGSPELLEKSFYFVNNSLTPDGWLWFEYAHPPAPYKCLGAVSLDAGNAEVRRFPHATISAETPVIGPDNRLWFCMADGIPEIWRMDLNGSQEKVACLPEDYINGRTVRRIGTHFSFSADEKYLLLDGKVGSAWFIATMEVETRKIQIIKEFPGHYNHAQFSPVDPELFCLSQDHWRDAYSGQQFGGDLRTWLMTIDGQRFEPAAPYSYCSPERMGHNASHEWWADDGTLCWIVYLDGAYEMDVSTREISHVWKRPICHAHCSPDRRFWVGDQSPYQWPKPCQVLFYDRQTGEEKQIVSGMQAPNVPRHLYHIDPHPRFIAGGEWIVYTTTVRGRVELALTPSSL